MSELAPNAARQLIVWEGGVPVVKNVPLLTPGKIKDLHTAAVMQFYSTPDDELAIEMGLPPSRFYGLTLLEVMLIKQAEGAARSGDRDDVEAIRDRLEGKPKTTAEVHSVSETYEQALNRIARELEVKRVKAAVVEAEVVEHECNEEPWTRL